MMRSSLALVVGIVLALTIFIGYHAIYLPQRKTVASLEAKVTEELATQEMQKDVAVLLERLDHYRVRLSGEPDPSWLTREVVALSQKNGVQLTSVTQDLPQRLGDFTRLGVSLQFSASYHQLGAFLDALERSQYFIKVERVSVTRAQREGLADIQLILSTLYVPTGIPGS